MQSRYRVRRTRGIGLKLRLEGGVESLDHRGACTCDVPRWRRARGRSPLALAQSPNRWLKKIEADARIIVIAGSEDENAFSDLARDYVEKARARDLDAEFVLVEGAGQGLDRRYHEPLTEAIEQLLGR